MKVLFDINIVLDVLLDRSPWVAPAKELWRASDEGRLNGWLAAISLPTIFYIVRRSVGVAAARDTVGICLEAFEICAVDRRVLEAAYALPGSDFEDNIQIACAATVSADFIVSRDVHGLSNSIIPVRSAEEMAKLLVSP